MRYLFLLIIESKLIKKEYKNVDLGLKGTKGYPMNFGDFNNDKKYLLKIILSLDIIILDKEQKSLRTEIWNPSN